MTKNNIYIFIATALIILVPVPGRLACGILLVLGINIFLVTAILFKYAIQKLQLDDLQPVLLAVFLISIAVIYKQMVAIYSPVLSLLLGFSIYMSAISTFIIGSLKGSATVPLDEELSNKLKRSGVFSLLMIVYFLFRDIFGYGTITLPVYDGMFVITLFKDGLYNSPSVFWASIPGALVLTALLLVLFNHLNRVSNVIDETEGEESAK